MYNHYVSIHNDVNDVNFNKIFLIKTIFHTRKISWLTVYDIHNNWITNFYVFTKNLNKKCMYKIFIIMYFFTRNKFPFLRAHSYTYK